LQKSTARNIFDVSQTLSSEQTFHHPSLKNYSKDDRSRNESKTRLKVPSDAYNRRAQTRVPVEYGSVADYLKYRKILTDSVAEKYGRKSDKKTDKST
jgi:hypothetical protein